MIKLKETMWEKVGVIRCGKSIDEAKEILYPMYEKFGFADFLNPHLIELKNMVTVGLLITESASSRKNSVGAHYRTDFKEKSEGWQKNTRIRGKNHSIEIL